MNIAQKYALFSNVEPTSNLMSEPFSTTPAIVTIVVIAVIGLGILVYFKKRSNKK